MGRWVGTCAAAAEGVRISYTEPLMCSCSSLRMRVLCVGAAAARQFFVFCWQHQPSSAAHAGGRRTVHNARRTTHDARMCERVPPPRHAQAACDIVWRVSDRTTDRATPRSRQLGTKTGGLQPCVTGGCNRMTRLPASARNLMHFAQIKHAPDPRCDAVSSSRVRCRLAATQNTQHKPAVVRGSAPTPSARRQVAVTWHWGVFTVYLNTPQALARGHAYTHLVREILQVGVMGPPVASLPHAYSHAGAALF